jgi:FlaA1/EpsC-like NDP-sugar epimerase
MISTDKAVRPSSIMGASKRICELIVARQQNCSTRFASVRFGNVLGSSGSVIPIFEKQIAKGGPIRVTDPGMTRYFMTIPEAVELVLQASTLCQSNDVFVLDMGTPVKLMDLARNMIELSGMVIDEDIKIEIVGARPGEKMHEELVT